MGLAITQHWAASIDNDAEGDALVLELDDGSRFLRFEEFRPGNGPDLFVYLSAAPAGASNGEVDAAPFVDLGAMSGNVGDQNYEIPPEVDLSDYQSVVIWCRRFTSGFGAAPLEPAA